MFIWTSNVLSGYFFIHRDVSDWSFVYSPKIGEDSCNTFWRASDPRMLLERGVGDALLKLNTAASTARDQASIFTSLGNFRRLELKGDPEVGRVHLIARDPQELIACIPTCRRRIVPTGLSILPVLHSGIRPYFTGDVEPSNIAQLGGYPLTPTLPQTCATNGMLIGNKPWGTNLTIKSSNGVRNTNKTMYFANYLMSSRV